MADPVPKHFGNDSRPAINANTENATDKAISGEGRVSALPNAAGLEYMKMLAWFSSKKDIDAEIKALAESELKYFKEAAKILKDDPHARSVYGGYDLISVSKLTGFLKQKTAQEITDMHLGSYVKDLAKKSLEFQKGGGRPQGRTNPDGSTNLGNVPASSSSSQAL